MIDEVDQRLKAWVSEVAGDLPVSFAAPDRSQPKPGINLYLLDLGAAPPARSVRRVPLQFTVCYLITVTADTPERAHHALGELVFSALETPEFEVDLGAIPVELWMALGLPPQPAFRLRLPVRRELKVCAKAEVLHVGAEALTSEAGQLVIRMPLKEG
jgi:hypothetical protein